MESWEWWECILWSSSFPTKNDSYQFVDYLFQSFILWDVLQCNGTLSMQIQDLFHPNYTIPLVPPKPTLSHLVTCTLVSLSVSTYAHIPNHILDFLTIKTPNMIIFKDHNALEAITVCNHHGRNFQRETEVWLQSVWAARRQTASSNISRGQFSAWRIWGWWWGVDESKWWMTMGPQGFGNPCRTSEKTTRGFSMSKWGTSRCPSWPHDVLLVSG